FELQVEKTPDNIGLVGSRQLAVGKENHPALSTSSTTSTESTQSTTSTSSISTGIQLSYRELNEKSKRQAHHLISKGVKSGTIVAIMMERSIQMIIGILGILKAGGAYLPIDPEYPEERINYILKDSNTKIVLKEIKEFNELNEIQELNDLKEQDESNELGAGIEDIDIHTLNHAFTSTETQQPVPRDSHPGTNTHPASGIAYIIYTSGTTGKPKGVMVEHASVVNMAWSQKRAFKIDETDRILQFSSISFDASVEQIYIALLSGAALVLADKMEMLEMSRFEKFIDTQVLTHIHAVPSFVSAIPVKKYAGLRRMVSGGDYCPPELLKKWTKYCDFINEYGPTETTVTSIQLPVKKGQEIETVTIGKPLDNTTLYVLDEEMKPVPPGVPAQLYIGGSGVTRGYMNRPELTAERFVKAGGQLAFPNNQSLYQTGDLVRWQKDGNIEYMGRIDRQVKIRGNRIELGEIENRILEHETVKETALQALEDKTGEKYLCAYVVMQQGRQQEQEELKKHLARHLPQYMVPAYIMTIEKMPLTPNGKIDTKALPQPEITSQQTYTPPANPIEEKLVRIWAEILETPQDKIGTEDGFFEIGGHSLRATVMLSLIHKQLHVKVPLAEVFSRQTVKALAEYIAAARQSKYTAMEPVEKKENYALSSAQKRLYFLQQMDTGSTAYNMPMVIPMGKEIEKEKLQTLLAKITALHESLRTAFVKVGDETRQRVYDRVRVEIEDYDIIEESEEAANRAA
ncbi:MAG: amino acid adenylation domain-containing protein, partial [bacterium]|nr:amino acid adenylation domain-containing protein [bacterium]